MEINNKKIIAVVGMAGSGKSEAIKYLQDKFGWPKIYFGKFTFDRIKKEGLETNYKNEKLIREKIRKELGMGAYARLALPEIKELLKKNNNILIESLYSWKEYKIFKEEFGDKFRVMAIHASPSVRFERLLARINERPMSAREEFIERDYSEIENTDKGGPIARADYHILNEISLEDLKRKIDSLNLQLKNKL
ncbi:MAG: AAA family ATPase [Patescibacteria group bacterium]|jgi:dephospho-CoA kinase|nr:AAA family ATPase [Patescibacteria group bacterium]